jgi:hypothetical protein
VDVSVEKSILLNTGIDHFNQHPVDGDARDPDALSNARGTHRGSDALSQI